MTSPLPCGRRTSTVAALYARCAATLVAATLSTGCNLLEPRDTAVTAEWSVTLPGENWLPTGTPALDSSGLYLLARVGAVQVVKLSIHDGSVRWLAPLRVLTNGPNAMLVRAGLVMTASRGGAVAYDAATGAVRWEHPITPIGPEFGTTKPAADDANLYVPDIFGAVTAVNIADGTRRWRWVDTASTDTRPQLFAAGVVDTVVYAVGRLRFTPCCRSRGAIIALDARTGRELGRFLTADSTSEFRSVTSDGQGRLILGNGGRSGVDAVDPRTWTIAWRVQRNQQVVFSPSPLPVRNGMVYAGWQDVVAIEAATGRELWSRGTEGTTFSVVACGAQVVAQHYNLTFFNRTTGQVDARNEWSDGQFPLSDLVEDGRFIYAISGGRAYAFPCRQ